MTADEMTADEMTADEMTADEMTKVVEPEPEAPTVDAASTRGPGVAQPETVTPDTVERGIAPEVDAPRPVTSRAGEPQTEVGGPAGQGEPLPPERGAPELEAPEAAAAPADGPRVAAPAAGVFDVEAAEEEVPEARGSEVGADQLVGPAETVAAPVLEEARPRLREELLPKSVLGLTAFILAFAVGAAFSGAVLYSYYEFKKDRTERLVAGFVQGFDKRFKDATATIEAEGHNAKAEIQRELEPLRRVRAEGQTLEAMVRKLAPSLFFVSTLDEAGQPSVGSAVAVASDSNQTLLLTSYTTVKAATRQPGPAVRVRKGTEEIRSTLWSWHEDRDMALIVLARGNIPTLGFAGQDPKVGDRVFAVSGLGAAGGAATQGFVIDVSTSGIQHDAAVGQSFQGGPIVNADGAVLGLASRSYAPLGFTSDQVHFSPAIRTACERVLRCPGGGPSGPGDRAAPAPNQTGGSRSSGRP